MTLYRKYRPQAFSDVSGQDHVTKTLINASKQGTISHAYLFNGPRGTGKTSSARIIAKVLNCENIKNSTPCQTCDACTQITAGNLIDIIEIDAASNRGIDEIRDLKETLLYQPSFVKSKVYIIDEVHMLTKEAFNALLKTLEEPPEYVYFILATTELEKIPETIISRCQLFHFRRIGVEDIVKRMEFICNEEKIKFDEGGLREIAIQAEGGLRDALTLLEQLRDSLDILDQDSVRNFLGMSDQSLIRGLLDACNAGDKTGACEAASKLLIGMRTFTQVYKDVLEAARENFLENLNAGKSTSQIRNMIERLEKNNQLFRSSQFPQLALEVTIAELMEGVAEDVVQPAPRVHRKVEKVIEPTPAPIKSAPVSAPIPAPPAPEKLVTKTVEPKVEPVKEVKNTEPPAQTGDIGLRDIKRSWRKIIDNVKRPTIRISLKEVELVELKGTTIIAAVSSEFHFKQLCKMEHIKEIEDTINEIVGHSLTLEIKNQETTTNGRAARSEDTSSREVPKIDNFVSEAKDIFAGL